MMIFFIWLATNLSVDKEVHELNSKSKGTFAVVCDTEAHKEDTENHQVFFTMINQLSNRLIFKLTNCHINLLFSPFFALCVFQISHLGISYEYKSLECEFG